MRSELTKILQHLILENSIPAKVLAKSIGKPYSTLLREINPYDTGAKLGVDTLMQIMQMTNDTSPLKHMAEQLGYTLIPASGGRARGDVADDEIEEAYSHKATL